MGPSGRSKDWILPCALQLSQAPASIVTSAIEVIQQGALAGVDAMIIGFPSGELHAPVFCTNKLHVF